MSIISCYSQEQALAISKEIIKNLELGNPCPMAGKTVRPFTSTVIKLNKQEGTWHCQIGLHTTEALVWELCENGLTNLPERYLKEYFSINNIDPATGLELCP